MEPRCPSIDWYALGDASAHARLNAVYALGAVGESAVDLLVEMLRQTVEPVEITDEPILTHAQRMP